MDLYLVPDHMLDDVNYITVDKCNRCLALLDVNDLEEHESICLANTVTQRIT